MRMLKVDVISSNLLSTQEGANLLLIDGTHLSLPLEEPNGWHAFTQPIQKASYDPITYIEQWIASNAEDR